LAKENCFSIRGGGERKREPILHTEKLPTSKREDRTIHMIRVEAFRARRNPAESG
jgi:hypothetical protein